MTKKSIEPIYNKMVNDVLTSIDIKDDYECTPYPIARHNFTCDDGSNLEIKLVLDKRDGKHTILLWSLMDGKYIEDFITFLDKDWYSCCKELLSDDVRKRVYRIIEDLVRGGIKSLKQRIKEEGIESTSSFILTKKRIKETIKLPCSCTISFYGEVLHGIEEILEYCKHQNESSSPYILKRQQKFVVDNNEIAENEIAENEMSKCTNFLICKDMETASEWIKEFVGMSKFSIYNDFIDNPSEYPPMICYIEDERYMLLKYNSINI